MPTGISPGQRRNAAFIGTKRANDLLRHEDLQCQQHYTLHCVIRSLNLSFDEFKEFHTVIIEAPLVSQSDFCTTMHSVVTKLTKCVTQVAIIAQPTLRRAAQQQGGHALQALSVLFMRLSLICLPKDAHHVAHWFNTQTVATSSMPICAVYWADERTCWPDVEHHMSLFTSGHGAHQGLNSDRSDFGPGSWEQHGRDCGE